MSGPASPLLSRLRIDLKTAMRARDTARLSVLRGVLADITNSTKTATPIKDDIALLALLRKRISTSKHSIQEFSQADRKELVTNEEEQLGVLEEYAGEVKTIREDDIRIAIAEVVGNLRSDGKQLTVGDVMKRTMGPSGALHSKIVEKSVVARIAKEVLAEKTST
jgi:uncharacterized protein